MARPAWLAAHSLARCTGRVEVLTDQGWRSKGTAFFVGGRSLLTCAHVVRDPGEKRVVLYVPCDMTGSDATDGAIRQLAVVVEKRFPPGEQAADAYPLPDVAVLQLAHTEQWQSPSTAWLDSTDPGDDLYAFGYTDEYKRGEALGHPARFGKVGIAQADDDGPPLLWKMKNDRVRPGLSGSPVMDLGTGRVVGIVKRSVDTGKDLGAYFVPMSQIAPFIPDLMGDNEAQNGGDPARDDILARQIWGGLINKAASALAGNQVAVDALAHELGLTAELFGDDVSQARQVARGLFMLDLEMLIPQVKKLEGMVGRDRAFELFDAIATCTSHFGEQWIAAETAAELAAQVDLAAGSHVQAGRVIYLKTEADLRRPYIRRANRDDAWSNSIECGVFSHHVDALHDLPKDLEHDLRRQVIGRFRGYSPAIGLDERDLDENALDRWNNLRPKLVDKLRKQRVVALLPPNLALDDPTVASLTEYFHLILLAADTNPPPQLGDGLPYQAMDPDVDSERASDALLTYMQAITELTEG